MVAPQTRNDPSSLATCKFWVSIWRRDSTLLQAYQKHLVVLFKLYVLQGPIWYTYTVQHKRAKMNSKIELQ
jgi:hypothetical protein